MSKLRTFKAQKGKVLYCPSGDIVFSDGYYATEKQDEIDAISKGVGIKEVTDTKEAKKEKTGRKRSVVSKPDDKKEEKKDEIPAEEKPAETTEAPAEEKPADESGKPQENDLVLKDDEDIEVMPKPRCEEILKHAGVAFKGNDGVAKLRELVEKLK